MTGATNWIVTTTGERSLDEIADDLARVGFAKRHRQSEIGIIAGAASSDVISRQREIPGVADVSPDHEVDIGPPDAPVTW
jgi:hypothetical protein